jgi:hypothetical protein
VAWAWLLLDADLVPESTFLSVGVSVLATGEHSERGFQVLLKHASMPSSFLSLVLFYFLLSTLVRSGVRLAEHGHEREASQC